jgi:hypothetical protein
MAAPVPGTPSPPAPAPASKAGESGESAADGAFKRLSELAWQALPALGSAAGFVAFVAVIGTAIEWIRFDAAHLPATQAVLVVPRHELIVIGALSLAVFVAGGLLAVLIVYLIDNKGDATVGTVRGIVIVGAVEMVIALFFIKGHSIGTYVLLLLWLGVIGVVAAYVVAIAMDNLKKRAKLKRARARVLEARGKLASADVARKATEQAVAAAPTDTAIAKVNEEKRTDLTASLREWRRAIREWATVAEGIIDDQQLTKAARHKRMEDSSKKVVSYKDNEKPEDDVVDAVTLEGDLDTAEQALGHVFRTIGDQLLARVASISDKLQGKALTGWLARRPLKGRPMKTRRLTGKPLVVVAAAGALLIVASIVGGIALVVTDHTISWLAAVLAVVALLVVTNILVARATTKFAWYGVSVFFSVLLFGAALTIARTLHEPKVQPIALVRKSDDVGVCGVYVTETSDRVYIGRLQARAYRPGLTQVYRPGLIFWIPRSNVEMVSVGQLERTEANKHTGKTFGELAMGMLAQLYKDRAEGAPSLKNESKTVVKGEPVKQGTAGEQTTTVTEVPPADVEHVRHPPEQVGASCTRLPPPTPRKPAKSAGGPKQ